MDLNSVISDLSNVYWFEIERNNPSYVYAIGKIRELCSKYGVTYRTSKEDILHDFVEEEADEASLLKKIKEDIESASNGEMVSSCMNKYGNIRENWRQSISHYVTNNAQLLSLLHDDMDLIFGNISNFESKDRTERLKPKKVTIWGDDGWPAFDENGNEVYKVESESEVQTRVTEEDQEYEKMKQEFETMRASLPKWMEYLTVLPEISSIYKTLGDTLDQFSSMKNTFLLVSFGKDSDFMNRLDEIMAHDKTQYEYLYHGTACGDNASSILEQGLYMKSDNIFSTTYGEFDKDTLLLYYHRGGSSIVIIKRPVGENIVREVTGEERENCHIISSALSGQNTKFDYIIPREYIVGYVDKENRQVVFQKDLSLEHHTSYEGK